MTGTKASKKKGGQANSNVKVNTDCIDCIPIFTIASTFCRVTWSPGIPGWQKICCCRARRGFCRDSILVCIHFTHAQDHDFFLYWHIIGAGYIGHCVGGSFYFVTFQKNGKRRQIWLNAFSCKQWGRRSLKKSFKNHQPCFVLQL